MAETTFTFRVDEALKTEFSALAKARDRSGAQLLRDFMRQFVQSQQDAAAHDAWFREQVQASIDDPRPSIPHAEVMADMQAAIQAARARHKADGSDA